MTKEAFLPLFFGDFLASTAEWEGEERALYLLLLGYQWSLGSLPDEPRRVCKLAGWDSTLFDRSWPVVSTKFPQVGGRRANARLEAHRARSKEISEKRAIAGARGGAITQAKSKQLPEESKANAPILPGHPSHPIPSKNSEGSSSTESPSLGGVGEDASRKRAAEPKGSRIPTPFLVTAEMQKWATEKAPHVNLEAATEDFCNYWRALPGQRSRKLDWVLTWKNRMKECEDKAVRRAPGKNGGESVTERFNRIEKELDDAGVPRL